MLNKMIVWGFITLLLIGATSISARTLTLDECIELAIQNNEDAVRARNNVKVADGSVWTSFGALLPSFSVSGSSNETHSPTGTSSSIVTVPNDSTLSGVVSWDDLTPMIVNGEYGGTSKSYSIGGDLSWTVFNGGSNIFNYYGSKAEKKYYKYLAEGTEQSLIYNVKAAYFNYLLNVNKEKIAEEAVKRGEEQLKLAESKYEVGSASKSDVLKAKVQYGNDRLELITSSNSLRTSKADLLYLIGLNVNADIDFSDQYSSKEYTETLEQAISYGLEHQPGLQAAKINVKVNNYGLKSTLGQYLPTLRLGLSKYWSDNTFSGVTGFDADKSQWMFTTSLSLPIFDNFNRKRSVTQAKVGLNNAKVGLQYAENNVALNIKKAYLDIERAREALSLAKSNEEAAEEDMSLVREKYRLGAATILELLDAQVSLNEAQNQRVNSDFSLSLAVANLENAMGVR